MKNWIVASDRVSVLFLIVIFGMTSCDVVSIDPVGTTDTATGTAKIGGSDSENGNTDEDNESSDEETTASDRETEACGNGILEAELGEQCDDGNTVSDDGCTQNCLQQCGFVCSASGTPCELNCEGIPYNSCVVSPAALAQCCEMTQTDPVLIEMCADTDNWPDTDLIAVCGDGEVNGKSETCDDGNTESGDGCSSSCTTECGFSCDVAGEPCEPDCETVAILSCDIWPAVSLCCDSGIMPLDGQFLCGANTDSSASDTETAESVCGDGVLDTAAAEECDDGNTTSEDGCSSTCFEECSFTCIEPGQPCEPNCEEIPFKTCLYALTIELCCERGQMPDETLDMCDYTGDTDVSPLCGNGVLEPENGEECDDGNTSPLDGCSGTCRRECDYTCDEPGAPCKADCTFSEIYCWYLPARAKCCDGVDWETIEGNNTLRGMCRSYTQEQEDTTPKTLGFDGTSWLFKADRYLSPEVTLSNPLDPLDDADYLPSLDGSEYGLTIPWNTYQGNRIFLTEGDVSLIPFADTSIEGTLVTETDDQMVFDLDTGVPAGGRVVMWVNEENEYQVEITVYGSGVPIISSERGTIHLEGIE